MATTTYQTNAVSETASAGTAAPKASFFSRLILAMQESRQRQAEIEIRRMRALVGDNDTGFKHALLPFRGE
jgi:hypothetical protein